MRLAMAEGIGPILTRRLIEAADGVDAACNPSVALLRGVEGIGSTKSQQIFDSLKRAREEASAEIDRATAMGVTIICPDDQLYPTLLHSIPDPPSVLYVKGTI